MVIRAGWVIASVALILLTGVLGGLARLGWDAPVWGAAHHGFLMASAGFGTLITLERAVAYASEQGVRHWVPPLWIPLVSAVSGVMALGGLECAAAVMAFVPALWILHVSVSLLMRHRRAEFLLMALGSLSWMGASWLWWRGESQRAWIGWLGFLILTVTGERLDLSRFLKPSPNKSFMLQAALIALVATLTGSMLQVEAAEVFLGGAVLLLAVWLLVFDAARFTLFRGGQAATSARSLLGGFVWLGVAGGLMAWHGLPDTGWVRDAQIHAFFLGFILLMVFAHAPIILPALTPFRIRPHRLLDLPPVILSLGLALRVGGDLGGQEPLRRYGGLATALALGVFALTALALSSRSPGRV